MDLSQIITTIITSGIVSTLIGGVIVHFSNKKLEDYRFLQLQRQKIEIIAQLFAKWIKYSGKEEEFLNPKGLLDYYEELNKMSLELSLWISNKEIVDDIMGLLHGEDKATNVRALVGQFRKIILSNNDDTFDPKVIILWPSDEMRAKIFDQSKTSNE
ncbi:hypothetical protein A2780_03875 [Candidatus Daviesbacteria bacterium RIFCSPHIGHO2_01_FULL_41_45]|uniref:Uncharacterized protein n=2 Tax=Candidatus Yanofskyibacteriota TaxID=1752733 RepID=A0A1F8G1S3_9BACT|nr:MAG: hypothetical protein A2780_03875 [Candidatus Daviesbacteria bacterium RIFCSPHIGHO2_01_FULL_41_45]OGN18758.1 MAG: hypothetical protein A3F25_03055 [Candidatus Yanofskybacteria bacterium RIFCSPHIGHO2_12_FULL_45_19b]OGN32966.1 MAG: hypothetical protein A3I32_01460 [Candidatus Yanofskybacteria bacterium RIFCSPLOWO2_02_FULL_45_10]